MRPQPADPVSGRRRRRPWSIGPLLPRLDRIITTLIAVPDHQIPAANGAALRSPAYPLNGLTAPLS
jgi:hypothetical protein